MNIREATVDDFELIWPIFHEIVKTGETYAYSIDTGKEEAARIWLSTPRKTYVLEENGKILGTYFIKTNQMGPGDHVCDRETVYSRNKCLNFIRQWSNDDHRDCIF